MSDFDREAERERLRERYEQDQRERESAERMSELLLQGATMTNAHCSTCGDPIFRYDGQEFCATCEQPVDRDGQTDGDTDDGATDVEVATPDEDTRVVFGDSAADAAERSAADAAERSAADAAERSAADAAERNAADAAGTETGQSETNGARSGDRTRDGPTNRTGSPPAAETEGSADIETARASLVRTLATFSRRAETTDDPRRAREHLEAAREAAEALAALRR
jgi:uncharacterized Zn finger protein (UPF0148 family)